MGGHALLELGEHAGLAASASSATQPEDPDALAHLGRAYMRSGEHAPALRCFQSSLAIRDDNASVHFSRTLLWVLDKPEEA